MTNETINFTNKTSKANLDENGFYLELSKETLEFYKIKSILHHQSVQVEIRKTLENLSKEILPELKDLVNYV